VVLLLAPLVQPRSAAASTQARSVSLTLRALRGGEALRVGQGQPPTLLAVFATWCRSCRDEVTLFNALEREFATSGVRVVALSADEIGDERVSRWLDVHRASYPVVRDSGGVALRALGVVGVPEVHLIDGDGRVVWSRRGPVESRLGELRVAVDRVRPR
jgi:peroxiredoxin